MWAGWISAFAVTSLRYSFAVPARVGGVDLSRMTDDSSPAICVPARVGGVDLSRVRQIVIYCIYRPRPCGRGGFKQQDISFFAVTGLSPPVWAGWI